VSRTRVGREQAAAVDAARARYVLWDYDHTPFPAGTRILDIGCGDREELRALAARGCRAIGIDVTMARDSAVHAAARVLLARAEHLPFRDASFDGAVMKVVLSYTDERVAVREVARVLRPGAVWELTVHGVGYYLRILLRSPLRRRLYAARTLLNTLVYRVTGRRWLLGTTIYQSVPRLTRDLERQGVRITGLTPSPTFAGLPYFIYLRAEKTAALPPASPAARG
jgi:SAM-dependent methyltransferase